MTEKGRFLQKENLKGKLMVRHVSCCDEDQKYFACLAVVVCILIIVWYNVMPGLSV